MTGTRRPKSIERRDIYRLFDPANRNVFKTNHLGAILALNGFHPTTGELRAAEEKYGEELTRSDLEEVIAQQRAKPPLDMEALQRSLRQLLRVQRGKFREADLRAALEENACELGEEDYARLFQGISDRGRVRLTAPTIIIYIYIYICIYNSVNSSAPPLPSSSSSPSSSSASSSSSTTTTTITTTAPTAAAQAAVAHISDRDTTTGTTPASPDSSNENQDYTCPHCNRTFTSHIGLVGHLRIHRTETGEPVPEAPTYTHRTRFHCPHCPRTFTHRMGLFGHMRIHESGIDHNSDTPTTPIMPSTTLAPSFCATTSASSVADSDTADFKCPHCPRTLTSRIGLVGHLRIHRTETGEPVPGAPTYTHQARLNCPHCPRTFTHRMGLFGHMRIHDDLR
nr:unnamed protein product [Spirometra erinaceieuropaei]